MLPVVSFALLSESISRYSFKYLSIHRRSQLMPRFTILAGIPATITFGSLNSFVTILPQPTMLLSDNFTFLPIFTSLLIHTCLPISILLAKLIGSPSRFVSYAHRYTKCRCPNLTDCHLRY